MFQYLLTEDSKSGLQFFTQHFQGTDVQCVGAGANSSIYKWLKEHSDATVFVIADGAAFGAELERIMMARRKRPDQIVICLPESFEWLILKSGVIGDCSLAPILDHPEDFIGSGEYLTWERFFTDLLEKTSLDTHYQYSKKAINPFYTNQENSTKIVSLIATNNIR